MNMRSKVLISEANPCLELSWDKLGNEIQEELLAHIEMRTADNIVNVNGMSADAARRDALLKFGNLVATKENVAGMDAA
jgi:macrolide transport system ATP-binding/permease protein